MKVLVLNCGSSSVKFQLLDMETETAIAKGIVEKIGTSSAILRYSPHTGRGVKEVLEVLDHETAIELTIKTLTHVRYGVIKSADEIGAIGHRVVHGGERFADSVLITREVIDEIRDCIKFAPLHNPHNLRGIEACAALLPGKDQVAVFDTAFHQNIPPHAYTYALPMALYRKLGIRRYGFHGTSHMHVAQKAAEILGKPLADCNLITCHLGNGASIAAVRGGVSVDTSMGFTPLEGLVMGTRCGDIDPALVPYLMEREGLSTAEVDTLMNKYSGLLGVSETTNDMRELIAGAAEGNQQHQLALDIFCYRVRKYIGAYTAVLGRIDAVVFTGGIGENAVAVRAKACEGLDVLGIVVDEARNAASETTISTGPVAVLVIPTNEELAIGRATVRVLSHMLKVKTEQIEDEMVNAKLAALSEHDKAQIAILWSDNRDAGLDYLVKQLRRDHSIALTPRALEVLLERMGLLEVEGAKPDEPAGADAAPDSPSEETTPTAMKDT
jgi:acetate kinase